MAKSSDAKTMTKSGRLRGATGRFVAFNPPPVRRAGTRRGKVAETAAQKAETPLRPAQCAGYLRRKLANSFPGIVQGFVKQAESGSVPHFKLTTELLEKQAAAKKGKGSAQRLWEDLQRVELSRAPEDAAEPMDVWRE